MIIVGLQNCPGCQNIHKNYPEVPYVEVPRDKNNITKDIEYIYNTVLRFNITEFPVLFNDSLTAILPLETIDIKLKEI